ncbi:ferredoxin [Clostridium sp. MCC353]|uniref:ATP-binding protein n=1 Tax=Clostridium sp. MCC353 TaxID=2592646 RepID=UPI001C0140F2|nr:4Fe-4S dicluster domain-containing protein [Clostridium sp. MCC353]MBT9777522.1 ferredoxin [Clostridium sp. MCC353]
MMRKIIQIDQKKCNGCTACATACHEGAIAMVNGKAQLMRDDYCDGLGDCLPACPTGAITFVEREAKAYDEAAVKENQKKQSGSSQLYHWPVQIKLLPVKAPYLDDADLLIAADCTAYAFGDFHNRFMKNRVAVIGCPKLDDVDYSEKLTELIKNNRIKSITVARMEVPCCGGIEWAVKKAVEQSGKDVPFNVSVITIDGSLKKV